jgi:hypothetical protein
MRQPPDEVDLPHQLCNILRLEAFKPDPFHSDRLPGVQVESMIDGAKPSAPSTITKLLEKFPQFSTSQHQIADPLTKSVVAFPLPL